MGPLVNDNLLRASDIEKFSSIEYKPLQPDMEEFLKWEQRIGEKGVVMAVIANATCLPGVWMAPDKFMLMCVDNFDLIQGLLAIAAERVNDYVKSLCASGVKYFRIAGAELASQTLMGPGWYEKLVGPYDKILVDIIHKYEGIAFYHCHGKIKAIINEIADTGIDVLSPLEAPPGGDIPMKEAKEMIGGRVCLLGNLDDLEFIGKKSRREIEEKFIKLIEDVGKDGGFVLGGTESGVYTEKMLDGFLHMAEISEKYGRYDL